MPEPELRSGLVIRHGGDLKQIQGLGEAMDTPMDHQGKHQAVVNKYRVGGDRHTHTHSIYIYTYIYTYIYIHIYIYIYIYIYMYIYI